MIYRVTYYTLAIMPDGTNGNVKQGHGIAYINNVISNIPDILNRHLAPKKLTGVILSIEKTEGEIIS